MSLMLVGNTTGEVTCCETAAYEFGYLMILFDVLRLLSFGLKFGAVCTIIWLFEFAFVQELFGLIVVLIA